MYSARSQILLIAAIVLLSWATSLVAAPSWAPIGEWQDIQTGGWNQTLRILQNDDAYVFECSFSEGTKIHSALIPIKAKRGEKQRFRDTESDYKEEYAILTNGDLALYDQEGFIRKAKRK